jgi:phage terminase Nu1 subunit (DNA packaging protein)
MKIVVLLMALILTSSVWARSGQRANERMPDGAYFRHQTSDGVVHLNRTLSMDAIRNGYQLLDQHGRVLEEVEGVPLGDAEAKALRMQRARQAREDRDMLRLYAGPEDAVRARDRKVEALELSISYEENNLAQLQMKLDDEIATAARNERAGRDVPELVKEAIDRLQRQIKTAENKLLEFDKEIDRANQEYAPIIERLQVIEKEKREGG